MKKYRANTARFQLPPFINF